MNININKLFLCFCVLVLTFFTLRAYAQKDDVKKIDTSNAATYALKEIDNTKVTATYLVHIDWRSGSVITATNNPPPINSMKGCSLNNKPSRTEINCGNAKYVVSPMYLDGNGVVRNKTSYP